MNTPQETQPSPDADALGLFAEASIALATASDGPALRQHTERLARLTDSDLMLLYEAGDDPSALTLVSHWGLAPEAEESFRVLGPDRFRGAGGLRAGVGDATPLSYEPLTQDLLDLGIRAYWAYPLWSDGQLIGQLFFGSRNWDRFHQTTLSVFAATTIQVAQVLERRRVVSEAASEPAWSEAGGTTAARKRQQFIAVLAHELRNPIAPIRSGLDLISTGLLDAEASRSTTQMMQRQIAHLVRLIDDLLDTVRLSTGRLQVKRQPVRLKDVVRSAIESIRPALQSKAQALRLDDDEAEVVVDVDPVRLAQAFVNILSASVKQTPEGGVIAVSVALQSAELSIVIEDQGPGLDREAIDNVFELFPNSAAKNSSDGVGIGLALVRGLVELNDGSVHVRNRGAGSGVAYTVTLPLATLDVSTLPSMVAGSTPTWPSHRLLIVDDNRDAADTLGLLFELDGHTIRLAHDGPSAVAEAREFQPEVILMDIGLPGFSGNEAARRIRQHEGTVRPFIIALTGWGAAEDREATIASGCDLHLVKPVAHEDLRRTMFELTSGRKEGHGAG